MFRNVLVGVNKGEGGLDAIALAKVLLAPGGELTVAHVLVGAPAVAHRWIEPELVEKHRRAVDLLEGATWEAGVEANIRWRGALSVGRGLHELAEMIDADLLVVGSSRRGLLGRVRMADDTHAALNGASCAIAVAPAGYSAEPPAIVREIGVGYDGSAESDHALAVAGILAGELGSKLSAFQVVTMPSFVYAGPSARAEMSSIDRRISRARERIAALGDIEAHAAFGDPVEELTLYSASLDLLIVGSRSYGPLGRLVHGSTTQHLARTARCPLLALTRDVPKAWAAESGGAHHVVRAG